MLFWNALCKVSEVEVIKKSKRKKGELAPHWPMKPLVDRVAYLAVFSMNWSCDIAKPIMSRAPMNIHVSVMGKFRA